MKKKIKNSVARRFKVTKTGKVMFAHQNAGHLKAAKSNKTKRRNKVPGVLPEMFGRKVKKLLGYL